MKKFLSLFIALLMIVSLVSAVAYAEDVATESSASDIVKVKVTAINKKTNSEEPIEDATVRLFIGTTEKKTAKTNNEGFAEISLAGLSLEERLNATISADKVVSVGKAIDGNARDDLFNTYPKDRYDIDGDGDYNEYIRYQMELHSEWIDEHGNWNGVPLPKTVETNKVDIVFVIDSTGSMKDEINNVKTNLASFSKNLIDKGLDIRFSIIEYRDITHGEKTKNHRNSSGSNWYSDFRSVETILGNITVDGGGDDPETVIDALGMMTDNSNMGWRSDAHKFAFVLTDADYKVNNNYGYENLSDITRTLSEMNVVTSVITSSKFKSKYNTLYDVTGGIFADIYSSVFNAEMLKLSDSIATAVTREMNLQLSEPRLKVNMSVCYFADDSTSQSASYKNSVKKMLNEYAHRIAETTDGHVLIDKVILFSTDNRMNFYFDSGDSPHIAAMADIRIESEAKDDGTFWFNVNIHNNAHVSGFFYDDSITTDNDYFSSFKHLKNKKDFIGKETFYRILSGGVDINGYSMIDADEVYRFSTTMAHETGHYLMFFRDEYEDADGSYWGLFNKPYPQFGLMDGSYEDIEMSKSSIDYAYMNGDFAGTAKSKHTEHSWERKSSCEDVLIELLTIQLPANNYNDSNEYLATYSKNTNDDRRATYSYAGLDDSDFLTPVDTTTKSTKSSVSTTSSYAVATFDSSHTDETTKTSTQLADFTVKPNTSDITVTLSPISGYEYELYYIKSGFDKFVQADLTNKGGKLSASVDVSPKDLAEIRVVASKNGNKQYNTYYIDRSGATNKGYLYTSADESVAAYVTTNKNSSYTFTADNTSYQNGEYFSLNQATLIDSDNDVPVSGGEIYSVASYIAEIDYSTISWFKYKDGIWKKINTDYSTEENKNIGARADLDGEGLYVLMAKKAPTGSTKKATGISFTQSTDRDAVITLTFNDTNADSKYYNVYYSEKQFTNKNDTDVLCKTFNANNNDLILNLLERDRTVYAAIEVVSENGSRSELSELIKIKAGEADSDGDGIPDWYCDKYRLWGVPGEYKDIANSDDDGDGLTNISEYIGGSDPKNPNDPKHTTNVAVSGLSLSPDSANIRVGETLTFTATVSPNNATNKNVRWSVADASIVSVTASGNSCVVTGLKNGSTTLYAASVDGGFSAVANITVSPDASSGDSSSGHTITFETNGGNTITPVTVSDGGILSAPAAPTKPNHVFSGWYTDPALTSPYNFLSKVNSSFTLYAKWLYADSSKIILTIGQKDAVVFGKLQTNDVAPKIVNGRTMLPIRFVAEALGAEVLWNALEPKKVIITKGNTLINVFVGSNFASVNRVRKELDCVSFEENNRTYLPLRFISETLGASVEWLGDTQQIIITK